jgi:hypothetical protein
MSGRWRLFRMPCLALGILCLHMEAQTNLVMSEPSEQTPPPQPEVRKLTLAAAIDTAESNYPRVRAASEQRNSAQSTSRHFSQPLTFYP